MHVRQWDNYQQRPHSIVGSGQLRCCNGYRYTFVKKKQELKSTVYHSKWLEVVSTATTTSAKTIEVLRIEVLPLMDDLKKWFWTIDCNSHPLNLNSLNSLNSSREEMASKKLWSQLINQLPMGQLKGQYRQSNLHWWRKCWQMWGLLHCSIVSLKQLRKNNKQKILAIFFSWSSWERDRDMLSERKKSDVRA